MLNRDATESRLLACLSLSVDTMIAWPTSVRASQILSITGAGPRDRLSILFSLRFGARQSQHYLRPRPAVSHQVLPGRLQQAFAPPQPS
jgi:hypothetical protein